MNWHESTVGYKDNDQLLCLRVPQRSLLTLRLISLASVILCTFSLSDHSTFVLNSHRNLQCPVTTNPLQFFKPVSHCKYSLNFKRHFVSIQRSPGLLASENRGVSRNTPSIYLLEAQNLIQDECFFIPQVTCLWHTQRRVLRGSRQ